MNHGVPNNTFKKGGKCQMKEQESQLKGKTDLGYIASSTVKTQSKISPQS